MTRARSVKVFNDLVAFAQIVSAKLGSSKSSELTVQANEDDLGGTQQLVETWGDAPLLYQPLPGGEALTVELGDERVVIATKERRWQIAIEAGEVVVRALGQDAAYVRLSPDGTCTIEAKAVNLGSEGGQLVALDSLVRSAISSAIAGHTHTGVTTGTGSSGNGVLADSVPSTAAERTKAV